ncbi:hypothetical protein FB451DRAFT_1176145 [Mycena latifolia]|nr:hypothetical protein FB451DRAFT_1176145 [Mycena latifolia]
MQTASTTGLGWLKVWMQLAGAKLSRAIIALIWILSGVSVVDFILLSKLSSHKRRAPAPLRQHMQLYPRQRQRHAAESRRCTDHAVVCDSHELGSRLLSKFSRQDGSNNWLNKEIRGLVITDAPRRRTSKYAVGVSVESVPLCMLISWNNYQLTDSIKRTRLRSWNLPHSTVGARDALPKLRLFHRPFILPKSSPDEFQTKQSGNSENAVGTNNPAQPQRFDFHHPPPQTFPLRTNFPLLIPSALYPFFTVSWSPPTGTSSVSFNPAPVLPAPDVHRTVDDLSSLQDNSSLLLGTTVHNGDDWCPRSDPPRIPMASFIRRESPGGRSAFSFSSGSGRMANRGDLRLGDASACAVATAMLPRPRSSDPRRRLERLGTEGWGGFEVSRSFVVCFFVAEEISEAVWALAVGLGAYREHFGAT